MENKIFENYMSVVYAPLEREKNVKNEYDNLYFWNRKYIGEFLPKDKESKILDIGCGLGQNLYTFSLLGYKNATGIDISPECVSFCKKKGFDVLKISAEDYLRDKIDSFDVITIYHVVEHIKKDEIINFLKVLRNSLRKGGVLIINIPNGNNSISGSHDRYVDITHEILYTPESMQEILLLARFEPKNITIKEAVAYAPDDRKILMRVFKKIILPVITLLVDLIWYIFFIAQGSAPKKNRPVLISISRK